MSEHAGKASFGEVKKKADTLRPGDKIWTVSVAKTVKKVTLEEDQVTLIYTDGSEEVRTPTDDVDAVP